MFFYKGQAVQIHDLLHINAECLLDEGTPLGDRMPEWVRKHLYETPFVVVRRAVIRNHCLPIGIRGQGRNQRLCTTCSSHAILNVTTPAELLVRTIVPSRADVIPALLSLQILKARWAHVDHPWGPAGSIGFELAAGVKTATPESDLDIVIRVAKPIPAEKAKFLCSQTTDLPTLVDIRVETPVCGFSLQEYARGDGKKILLRTPTGPVLGYDPWSNIPDAHETVKTSKA